MRFTKISLRGLLTPLFAMELAGCHIYTTGSTKLPTLTAARTDVFDCVERFYNPEALNPGLPEPYGLRAASTCSLAVCPRNRQQLHRSALSTNFLTHTTSLIEGAAYS